MIFFSWEFPWSLCPVVSINMQMDQAELKTVTQYFTLKQLHIKHFDDLFQKYELTFCLLVARNKASSHKTKTSWCHLKALNTAGSTFWSAGHVNQTRGTIKYWTLILNVELKKNKRLLVACNKNDLLTQYQTAVNRLWGGFVRKQRHLQEIGCNCATIQ